MPHDFILFYRFSGFNAIIESIIFSYASQIGKHHNFSFTSFAASIRTEFMIIFATVEPVYIPI